MKEKNKNSCYTYFKITGNFDPDVVSGILQLTPERKHKASDTRRDGKQFGFASWEFGRCKEYDVHIDNQMRQTVAPLQSKIDLLNKIRLDYDLTFTLVVVPTVCVGGVAPCLAPSLDVMDFCHATRTEIDIDLYLLSDD